MQLIVSCVCVWVSEKEKERERERESVCVCVCVCVCMCICVCVVLFLSFFVCAGLLWCLHLISSALQSTSRYAWFFLLVIVTVIDEKNAQFGCEISRICLFVFVSLHKYMTAIVWLTTCLASQLICSSEGWCLIIYVTSCDPTSDEAQ